MILEYIGEIEIENGLTLLNPKMEIIAVYYKLATNIFEVEVEFYESMYRHNRRYEGTGIPGAAFSMGDINTFVSQHTLLSQFTII